MAESPRKILICSCDDTMPLDEGAVKRGCRGAEMLTAHQLCRLELEKFRKAAAAGEPITVACTQEAPLFAEAAGDADIRFVNIRETAGWSKDAMFFTHQAISRASCCIVMARIRCALDIRAVTSRVDYSGCASGDCSCADTSRSAGNGLEQLAPGSEFLAPRR